MGFLPDKQSNTHSKTLSASFKHPTLSKLHFHEWWILALDGGMKYSITLFSCANEAECGFRGFLFSKVACLVMHMLPSYVSFHVSVCTQAVVGLNGQLWLICLRVNKPWPSSAQQEQPWPVISRAIKPTVWLEMVSIGASCNSFIHWKSVKVWFGLVFPLYFLCITGRWCEWSELWNPQLSTRITPAVLKMANVQFKFWL